jgi:hypothetical protein
MLVGGGAVRSFDGDVFELVPVPAETGNGSSFFSADRQVKIDAAKMMGAGRRDLRQALQEHGDDLGLVPHLPLLAKGNADKIFLLFGSVRHASTIAKRGNQFVNFIPGLQFVI